MSEPIYKHHIKDSRLRYLGSFPISGLVYDLYVDVCNEKNPSYHARYSSGDTGYYNWTETMVLGINDGSNASHTLALREAMRRHRAAPGDAPKPRFTHHERSSACAFLGHFEENGKDYDLYVYEPDTTTTYYTARWGSNSNQYWTKIESAIKEQLVLPHRAALTAAMMRHKEKIKAKPDLLLPHQKRIIADIESSDYGPRWKHPEVSGTTCVFLGRHADSSGDYDLYLHPGSSCGLDRDHDMFAARFGLSDNACAVFYRYALDNDTSFRHRNAVREARRRADEGGKKATTMRPKYKHHSNHHTYLGTMVAACEDYDLYVYTNGNSYVYARYGNGSSDYACSNVELIESHTPSSNGNSRPPLRELFREAVKRWDQLEKEHPMMTLHIDVDGQHMTGGHNIQSIPKGGLRDLSGEEVFAIPTNDKLQGAIDQKNRMISSVADAHETQRNILRSLGVPAEYLGIPQGVIPLPGPFVRRVIYESPLHAFGLTADHPGFQRPLPPAKVVAQEARANSLFGSDIKEAHTKESDDRRERFKMALRHCFPPSMPFDPENVEGGDVCLKEIFLAAAELKLSSEPRFRWDQGREGRKHSFEWHFMDNMRRPAFGFQVRFWAEAPTKEEAWKTLEAGVMAFAGKEE